MAHKFIVSPRGLEIIQSTREEVQNALREQALEKNLRQRVELEERRHQFEQYLLQPLDERTTVQLKLALSHRGRDRKALADSLVHSAEAQKIENRFVRERIEKLAHDLAVKKPQRKLMHSQSYMSPQPQVASGGASLQASPSSRVARDALHASGFGSSQLNLSRSKLQSGGTISVKSPKSMNYSTIEELALYKYNQLRNTSERIERMVKRYAKSQHQASQVAHILETKKKRKEQIEQDAKSGMAPSLDQINQNYDLSILQYEPKQEERKRERIFRQMKQKYSKAWKENRFAAFTSKYQHMFQAMEERDRIEDEERKFSDEKRMELYLSQTLKEMRLRRQGHSGGDGL